MRGVLMPYFGRTRYKIYFIGVLMAISLMLMTSGQLEAAPDVTCRLKSDAESVDVKIVVGKKEIWHARIPKDETKEVRIPDGPFTVISKVYNPNLQTQEDIRSEAHTQLCDGQAVLPVPFFGKP
jgi:hypothetical protein